MFRSSGYYQSPKNHTLRKSEPKPIPKKPKRPLLVRTAKKQQKQIKPAHLVPNQYIHNRLRKYKRHHCDTLNPAGLSREASIGLIFLGLIICAGAVNSLKENNLPPKKSNIKKEIAEICKGEKNNIQPANKIPGMRLTAQSSFGGYGGEWIPEICAKNTSSISCNDERYQYMLYTGRSYYDITLGTLINPSMLDSISYAYRDFRVGISRTMMQLHAMLTLSTTFQFDEEDAILASTSNKKAHLATENMFSTLHSLQTGRIVKDTVNSRFFSSYGNCGEFTDDAAIKIREVASTYDAHIDVTRVSLQNSWNLEREYDHVILIIGDKRPAATISYDFGSTENYMVSTEGYICDPWNGFFGRVAELGDFFHFYIKYWNSLQAVPLRLSYSEEPLLSSTAINFFSRKIHEIGLRSSDSLPVLDLDKEDDQQNLVKHSV